MSGTATKLNAMTNSPAALDTAELAVLVDRKLLILGQLRDLGRQQIQVIAAGAMNELFGLLSSKQTLLSELQKVDRALDPFRGQNPEQRTWASPAIRERCRKAAAASEVLLAEVMQYEREGEGELARRRDRAAESLQGMSHIAEAQQAYAAAQPTIVRALDLASETLRIRL